MKQSKLPVVLEEWAKEMVEDAVAQEREKYSRKIQEIARGLLLITRKMEDLAESTKGNGQLAPVPPANQPKKRKAVEANEAEYDAVHEFFQDLRPVGSVVTVKTIHRADIGCGPRIIAAACRMLVAHGEIEAVGRKGYRVAQRRENGLDETVPTRTLAE